MPTQQLTNGLYEITIGEEDWGDEYNTGVTDHNTRSTLSYAGDPNGNVIGSWLGQTCFDTTNLMNWTCVLVGDANAAEWRAEGVPLGSIHAFPFKPPPAGYVRLNGQTVSKTDYPKLFDVVPESWKSGNNIILPQSDEHYLVGGAAEAGIGVIEGTNETDQAGGHNHGGATQAHALTIEEMPAHTHQHFAVKTEAPSGGSNPHVEDGSEFGQVELTTGETGGGNAHSHDIDNAGVHKHILDPKRITIIYAIRAY